MSAKHTPGPWKCDKDPVFGSWFVRQDPVNWNGMGYQLICDCPADKKGTHYGDMFKANARLIAAAPDLLRALQALADAEAAEERYAAACLSGDWTEGSEEEKSLDAQGVAVLELHAVARELREAALAKASPLPLQSRKE